MPKVVTHNKKPKGNWKQSPINEQMCICGRLFFILFFDSTDYIEEISKVLKDKFIYD